jgi:hypothetical protein
MRSKNDPRSSIAFFSLISVLLLIVSGCLGAAPDTLASAASAPAAEPTPAEGWPALLERVPFPYLLPLPASRPTAVDGTYTKVELKETPPVHCLRCPDYAPEGGLWKLNLERGVFRIYHQPTGWKSIGSFVVTRDRWTAGAPDQLLLFNDPTCPDGIGLYTWRVSEGDLILEVIDDTCAIYLRAANLTNLPWLACRANTQDAATEDGSQPPGCD